MNIDWVTLKPFLDAAAGATLPLLAFCYFRLDSKIEKNDLKIENSKKEIKDEIISVRSELKDEMIRMEQKVEARFNHIDNRFDRLETKFDRLIEMFYLQNQISKAGRYRNKPHKDVG